MEFAADRASLYLGAGEPVDITLAQTVHDEAVRRKRAAEEYARTREILAWEEEAPQREDGGISVHRLYDAFLWVVIEFGSPFWYDGDGNAGGYIGPIEVDVTSADPT